ncbi:MAG: RNA polymerase sigma factor [bacterium]
MTQHEAALLRYANRIVGDAHLAQDVVQNAFVKLFAGWKDGTRPSDKLKTWLYRVTHNEAVDLIRRESRLQVLHQAHAEEKAAACPDGQHCAANGNEQFETVLRHLRRLEPLERQVLLLRLEEGLSYAEIAAVTGRTTGNIGCVLHNAVTKLSKILAK